MNFEEIRKQSSEAAERQSLIDRIKTKRSGDVNTIQISYLDKDGCVKLYRVEKHTDLWRDLLEVTAEKLEAENVQTASNLQNWTK